MFFYNYFRKNYNILRYIKELDPEVLMPTEDFNITSWKINQEKKTFL